MKLYKDNIETDTTVRLKNVATNYVDMNIHGNMVSVPRKLYGNHIEGTDVTLTINKRLSKDLIGLIGLIGIACLQQHYGITEQKLKDAFPEVFI